MTSLFRHVVLSNICMSVFAMFSYSQDSVSISDFRYPETRAIDVKLGLNGQLSDGHINQNAGDDPQMGVATGSSSRSGGLFLQSRFLFFHVHENHSQQIDVNASVSYDERGSKWKSNHASTTPSVRDDESDRKTASLYGTWGYQHYPGENDLHVLGQGLIRYNGSYEKKNAYYTMDLSPPASYESVVKQVDIRTEGFLGIGFGRIRDGSFVFRTLRILDKMREDGLIKENLSREQILDVVDHLAHSREYLTNYERWEKYLVEDIASELVRIGAIHPQDIKPYSSMRIAEALHETIEPRHFGWRVYYAFGGFNTQGLFNRSDSRWPNQDDHRFVGDGAWLVFTHRLGGEFGEPLSLSTHFHSDFAIDLPTKLVNNFYSIKVNASMSHELGERVDVLAGYSFSRGVETDSYRGTGNYYAPSLNHRAYANIVYFLEDELSFALSFSYYRTRMETYPMGSSGYFQRSSVSNRGFGITFGLQYNII